MAGSQIIKIENNDSDLRFRQKCNQNFNQLVRDGAETTQTLKLTNLTKDEELTIITNLINAKPTREEMGTAIALATSAKLSNITAGPGLNASIVGITAHISMGCPIPINGIFFFSSEYYPSTIAGWSGTTWEAVTQTAIPAQAWKRLT